MSTKREISHQFEGVAFTQMTLGGLQKALAMVHDDTLVKFDNGDVPGDLRTYRGNYNEAAISDGWGKRTVGELFEQLINFIGTDQPGYKGGEYLMHQDTPLWCAQHGNHGYPIVGTTMRGDTIVLLVDVTEED